MNKKTNMKKAFTDFFDYIGTYKIPILISFILSTIAAIITLIGPSRLSEITNLITEGLTGNMNTDRIVSIAIFLAIIYILGYIVNYAQGFIMATISQKITRNMRHDISRKINKLPLNYFDTHSIGDTLSRVTNDVDTVGQMLNQSLSSFVYNIALLIGAIYMMLRTNWIMALSGMSAAIIGFVVIIVIMSKSQRFFSAQQNGLADINGQIEEDYSGLNVIKTYNQANNSKKSFNDKNNKLYDSAWKSQFLSGMMQPLMMFTGNLSYVVICIVGAVLAMQDIITFGVIVAFMLYIRNFSQPLQTIAQVMQSIQSMAAACERVFAFLDEEEMDDEISKVSTINEVQGYIDFEHVQFGYNKNRIIINDFTESVKPGQKVAIVGPTGAGKTTLVNLLMRFYEINKGSIKIDGIDTKSMKREDIHQLFGMVLQDTWLFEGTLRENLVYNKTGITDERLDQVCEAVGLKDLVEQLPKGYDTVLNDAVALSVGQKQLLTIARAMIEDAPLLILDEATSSVDTRTERKVQKAMDLLTEGRTSFVIAHRLSTIKNADVILVLKDGDIIESGNHEELMNQGGFYKDLYNSQFEVA